MRFYTHYHRNGKMYRSDSHKLISVEQWGSQVWKSTSRAFFRCSNMTIKATDKPNLSNVTNMSSMFFNASAFNQDISNWDVSSVTEIGGMFQDAESMTEAYKPKF